MAADSTCICNGCDADGEKDDHAKRKWRGQDHFKATLSLKESSPEPMSTSQTRGVSSGENHLRVKCHII
jgi:hypothetical protein